MKTTLRGFFIGIIIVAAIVGGFILLLRSGTNSRTFESAGSQIPQSPLPTQEQAATSTIPEPTPAWKVYTNQAAGFSLEYPSSWTVHPTKDYIGFISDEWAKDKIQGDTLTVSIFKNALKDKIIHDSGFQTIAEAHANNTAPTGADLTGVEYLTTSSAAGPAVIAATSTINRLPAISADIETRLYGGKTRGYIGQGDGKNMILFGNGIAANIWFIGHGQDFDHILSSFKF